MHPGGILALIVTWMVDYALGRMHRVIALRIPQCDTCIDERREVRVLYIDFETAVVTLVVRKEFKSALNSAKLLGI
jgi:hypothetical protein